MHLARAKFQSWECQRVTPSHLYLSFWKCEWPEYQITSQVGLVAQVCLQVFSEEESMKEI